MKQTIEERRLHHQTREDRQRKAYEACLRHIREGGRRGRNGNFMQFDVGAAQRDAA